MYISFIERRFYPGEQRLLMALKTRAEKESKSKIRYYYFFIATLSGISFTWLAMLTKESFWVLPFGTLAVFSFAFIVFAPYEVYKMQKKNKAFLQLVNDIIAKGTVDTSVVNAKRIALAKEFEDEGDLFIIEYDNEKVLYLWDYDYNLQKKFPCLDFEIYEDQFFKLSGKQVYPLSGPIKPIIIDKKAKWNYIRKIGAPGHLQTQDINFDKLIADINSYS